MIYFVWWGGSVVAIVVDQQQVVFSTKCCHLAAAKNSSELPFFLQTMTGKQQVDRKGCFYDRKNLCRRLPHANTWEKKRTRSGCIENVVKMCGALFPPHLRHKTFLVVCVLPRRGDLSFLLFSRVGGARRWGGGDFEKKGVGGW